MTSEYANVVLTDEEELEFLRARVPAIAMVRTPNSDDAGTPGCWFGGDPTLPADIPWPSYWHKWTELEIPLQFIVQLNLAYLPRVFGQPSLPDTGTLFVFYDPAVAPLEAYDDRNWISPFADGTGVRLIHVDRDVSDVPPRTAPPLPDVSHLDLEESTYYNGDRTYKKWPFHFSVIETFSGKIYKKTHNLLGAFLEKWDALEQFELSYPNFTPDPRAEKKNGVVHQVFGASHLRDLPTDEHLQPRGVHHGDGATPVLTHDHVMLFRFAIDFDIGLVLMGQTPFSIWMKKDELKSRDFSNACLHWSDD